MASQAGSLEKVPRRWWTVFALSVAAFVDSSENNTLSILWPSMYRSLNLRVGLLGSVLGISGLINTISLPLWGFAADRFSRRKLLIWVTGFWGMWTMAIGLVQSLNQLYLVRVFSSLGLGVLWPTAFSLISDLFPSKLRGRAAGVMTAVSFLGTLGAYAILPALAASNPEGWRWGFIAMGLASFASGFLMLVINDPPRGSSEPELKSVITHEKANQYALQISDLPILMKVKTWKYMLAHNAFDNIALAVLFGWSFTWLDSLNLGGQAFAVIAILMLGTLSGHALFGWLGDVLEQRHPRHGRVMMAQIGLAVSIPSLAGFLYFGSRGFLWLVVFGLLSGLSLSSVDTGARWPLAQGVLRPELRASGRALLDVAIGAAGALGVWLSGILIDFLGGNITHALLIMIPLPKLISSLLWLPLFSTYPRDQAELSRVLAERREELDSHPDAD